MSEFPRSSPPYTDIAQTRKYLTAMIESPTNGVLDFVLVLSSSDAAEQDGIVIGKAGIWSSTTHEIGFMLNRNYWGNGYMVEALAELLPHIWSHDIEKISADVDPRNVGSIGLLKKYGFLDVGIERNTIETHLGWCDSLYMEFKRPQEQVKVD